MQTDEFAGHLATLTEAALRAPTAIMCAEADPLHCHRSFIADALAACGIEVRHILGESSAVSHALRQSARVAEGRVSYPGPTQLF
jgi:uncharacterized protein (DUF488 family)